MMPSRQNSRFDILLIQPPIRDFYLTAKRTVPYGLASIAAGLIEAGFSVQILDALSTAKSRVVDLPPEMVLAVIQTESNFDRWAISVAGAQGLMQIMPFWLREIGIEGDSLFSIKTNLRFGCTILRHYLDKEKGDWTKALARYNGSYGKAKYPRKVFANLRKNWFRR